MTPYPPTKGAGGHNLTSDNTHYDAPIIFQLVHLQSFKEVPFKQVDYESLLALVNH
jgi:hypothetical protein